jgi:hypothetical protein
LGDGRRCGCDGPKARGKHPRERIGLRPDGAVVGEDDISETLAFNVIEQLVDHVRLPLVHDMPPPPMAYP